MKKLLKKICAMLMVLLITSTLVSCGKSSGSTSNGKIYRTLEEIKESGVINIGVFTDSPFGYVDENGENQGYDIYFARRVGEDLGVKVNLISTEPANRIEYLKTGKADLMIANFTVTEERKKEVDFALPYMKVSLALACVSGNVITSFDQLKEDDVVIVTSGTTGHLYLEKNYPNIKLKKFDSFASAITAFENKEGVAWANDSTDVIKFVNDSQGYTVGIASFGGIDTIAPAVSKGNESLLNWVNEEIVNLGKENFFHKDYNETLLETYGADFIEELVVEGGVVSSTGE